MVAERHVEDESATKPVPAARVGRKGGIAVKRALIVLYFVGWLGLLALAIHWQMESQRVTWVTETPAQMPAPAPVVQVPAHRPILPVSIAPGAAENQTENLTATVGAVRCSFTVVNGDEDE